MKIRHNNGFGALRLMLASLVLISHGAELIDGNRGREILSQIFGSLSFGELAVDGFFLLSGALITASWLNSTSWRDYLWRRVIRIYPAFLVAATVAVLVVAPLGGTPLTGIDLWAEAGQALRLASPQVQAFLGQPYPVLNGSAWTVQQEFNCYLMVMGLGLLGILKRRWLVLALALVAQVLAQKQGFPHVDWTEMAQTAASSGASSVTGASETSWAREIYHEIKRQFWPNWRLIALFLAGSAWHLWGDLVPWRRALAVLAGLGLMGALALGRGPAEVGSAVFGGYLLFYLARAAAGTVWSRINTRNDISYGIYLYGWPVQKLVWWFAPDLPLVVGIGLAFGLTVAMGWISWLCIERPVLRWGRRRLDAAA